MKKQKIKTEESMEALQAGLAHLKKKIYYYTLVSEAIKNGTPIPQWSDDINEDSIL